MTNQSAVSPWAAIVGPCYTVGSLSRSLGWTETDVVGAAASLSVLELETIDGLLLYPAFQVCEGRVLDGLSAVLRVLSSGTSSRWTWAQWLNTRVDDESGEEAPSAIDQLRAGQLGDLLRDARHVAWSWSN